MCKLKTLSGFLLAVFIVAGIALPCYGAAKQGNEQTRITKLRALLKGNRTCLIFDAEGAKPKQIGPASRRRNFRFLFADRLQNSLIKLIADKIAAAREVKFRRESGFFEVIFRENNTTVSWK